MDFSMEPGFNQGKNITFSFFFMYYIACYRLTLKPAL